MFGCFSHGPLEGLQRSPPGAPRCCSSACLRPGGPPRAIDGRAPSAPELPERLVTAAAEEKNPLSSLAAAHTLARVLRPCYGPQARQSSWSPPNEKPWSQGTARPSSGCWSWSTPPPGCCGWRRRAATAWPSWCPWLRPCWRRPSTCCGRPRPRRPPRRWPCCRPWPSGRWGLWRTRSGPCTR